MAKKKAKSNQQKVNPADLVAQFNKVVEEVVKSPDEKVSEEMGKEAMPVLDAVAEILQASSTEEVMRRALMVAIKGEVKPDYVTSDGNCFIHRNFYQANEHCLSTGAQLYKVVYGDKGEPIDLVKFHG